MAGAVKFASPLLQIFRSNKVPAAQPAKSWRSMLVKDPGMPNPEFNPNQLTLPGFAPAKTVLSGKIAPNIPGTSKKELEMSKLAEYLQAQELTGKKIPKTTLEKMVEEAQPKYWEEVYAGPTQDRIDYEVRQMMEADADWARANPDLAVFAEPPRLDRANRMFTVDLNTPLGYDLDPIEIPFEEIRQRQYPNMTEGALARMAREQRLEHRRPPREVLDELIERRRARVEDNLREQEADLYLEGRSVDDYDNMARESLLERAVPHDDPSQYVDYLGGVPDETYHEYVLRAEHPDFEPGEVMHFDSGESDIVAHILANKGRIIEMQSDAAQSALEALQQGDVPPKLLHPQSADALMSTLKGYLQWAAKNKILSEGEDLTFPSGSEVARRWGQPLGPVTFKGVKITPVAQAGDDSRGERIYQVAYEATHPFAEKPKRIAMSRLGLELGPNADKLTHDILERGGRIDFTPYDKEVGLKAAYDMVLPNAVNAAFKKYNTGYGPDRKMKITPELWKAMTGEEFAPYAKGGSVRR